MPKKEYITLTLLEVLLLQRFPYKNNSTFFYYSREPDLYPETGDLIEVPFRRSIKKGVVVKLQKIVTPNFKGNIWETNLRKLIGNKNYFYCSFIPPKIKIREIISVTAKKYFPENLIRKSKILSEHYLVSWNHFAKYIAQDPKMGKHSQISYLATFGKMVELVDYLAPIKNTDKKKENLLFEKGQKLPYVFLSQNQTSELQKIVVKTIQKREQVLIVVPEKTQLLPVCAKYYLLAQKVSVSSPIILSKALPHTAFREGWQLAQNLRPAIFIGTRSSIFAPFLKLGLVILEDGHDPNFKQWDMSPRYDVRSVLPTLYDNVLKLYLSQTPRLEDFFNSPYFLKNNKIIKFNFPNSKSESISEKPEENPPHKITQTVSFQGEKTKISIINLKLEAKLNEKDSIISQYLKDSIKKSLLKKKWVVILAGRKGIARLTICRDCGYIPNCPNCQKPLFLNKNSRLECHNCSFVDKSLGKCPKCQGSNFYFPGAGIEKVKEELLKIKKEIDFELLVPIDAKSTFKQYLNFWNKLVDNAGKPCIVVGYGGMIALLRLFKKQVGIASFVSFDSLLYNPNYNSEEVLASRFFNLVSISPKIILQTSNPNHPFLEKIIASTYSSLFPLWLNQRKTFQYPPFSLLVKLEVSGKTRMESQQKASFLADKLKTRQGVLESFIAPGETYYKKGSYFTTLILKTQKEFPINKILANLPNGVKIDIEPESLN